ncbi:MAG: class I SAM-dependent methyltransferase [Gammaproteobacteria bacterium]|nr:class I SAM-dependent methyltransferase [Gammaproteobacteria bacterium]MCW9005161.1 class I SAM-dependent methyltransferase [Gammaproteobacteria bacterium]MCW9055526.1 class I SAM-dependent methyltransferase [Gammaproteobacteria bacterium]
MWDERYSADEYAYGKQPNDFLVESINKIPAGKVLCLADGEGRNSVYLAEQGFEVTSVDSSAPGMQKADQLASERGVEINTVVSDLSNFDIKAESWDAVISIFCHLPPQLRKTVHKKVVSGLKTGGVLILEAYTPEQLMLGTGGPTMVEMTMTLNSLKTELNGLNFIYAIEKNRQVIEGIYHTGNGAVVQLIAKK